MVLAGIKSPSVNVNLANLVLSSSYSPHSSGHRGGLEVAKKVSEIRGEKERELKRIQSGAYKTAQEIKGKADAGATRIYAEAYNLDPEFYQFMRTLETYRIIMDKETILLLSTDAEFLKYLKKTTR